MKKIILVLISLWISYQAESQSVGIGTNTPNQNAKLDIVDSTKGILIPRTTSQKRIIIPNVKGMLVFDTDTNSFWYNDGTKWLQLLPTQNDNILTHIYLTTSF